MNIILKRIHMENFKIFLNKTIDFGRITRVFAQNYRGKSSIVDGFFWVLFGKSSTGDSEGKEFQPRRHDENGVDVDRVPVIVELTLQVDDREIVIRKVQEQKWVRKRGDDFETYEGDANKYFWNEVEVKESEHKKRVAEIIDEDLFKMITNPHAFTAKKQDEQKKILTEKVARVTDEEVFAMGGFNELQELIKANTFTELISINKKALQGYKDEQKRIPAQIAERSKDIVDIDFAEQELALTALVSQMEEIERKITDTSSAYEDIAKIKQEKAQFELKLSEIEKAELNSLTTKRREAQTKVDNTSYTLMRKIQERDTVNRDIISLKEKISSSETYFEVLKKRYESEKSTTYNETKNNCPTCGKEFEESKKSELVAAFEIDKKSKLNNINIDGGRVSAELKANRVSLEELETKLSTITEDVTRLTEEKSAVKAELAAIPATIDLSGNADYQGLKASIAALESALTQTMESLKDTDAIKIELTARKSDIQSQIDAVKAILSKKQTIDDAKDRVAELNEELRQATIKAAQCEKVLLMVENFEKVKTTLLTERVNSHFKLVTWSFEWQQKNGGVEQYCSCSVKGTKYGKNRTSTAQKLMAGLDIINTLQEIYGVKAPIFIDDKEHYNDKNIPEMGCQLVMLSVSDDEDLRVEVEE